MNTLLQPAQGLVYAYAAFFINQAKITLYYRGRVLLWSVANTLIIFVLYFLWRAVYANSSVPVLAGFNLRQVITYVMLSSTIIEAISGNWSGLIALRLQEGRIVTDLVRPVDFQALLLAEQASDTILRLIVAVPIWLVLYLLVGVQLPSSWDAAGLFLLSCAMAYLIAYLIDFTVDLVAFYSTDTMGLGLARRVVVAFLAGGYIPIAFFPGWLQTLSSYLPFQAIVFLPLQIYLGQVLPDLAWRSLLIQLFWFVVLLITSRLLFRIAVRKVTVQGG
jgi:ABC-2 type transport system permease protein